MWGPNGLSGPGMLCLWGSPASQAGYPGGRGGQGGILQRGSLPGPCPGSFHLLFFNSRQPG